MLTTNNPTYSDPEAVALAACYRLLLQKAAERRARLSAETAAADEQQLTESQEMQDDGRVDD